MAVLDVRVADRMHVDYHHRSSGSSVQGYLDGQVTQPVSMTGASSASATAEVVAFKQTGDEVRMFLDQSNDCMNWFTVADKVLNAATPMDTASGTIGMAWVRVVFLIRRSSGTPVGAVVKCDLTTSL